jgi:ABC-type lipoprotein export system ATPase subunit
LTKWKTLDDIRGGRVVKIIVSPTQNSARLRSAFALHHNSWNDWWRWETLYRVEYYDQNGEPTAIGYTKIASAEHMKDRRPDLPTEFSKLPTGFFSLGQDADFYANLLTLPRQVGKKFLEALQDVVALPSLFDQYSEETVMTESLLRNVSHASVVGQFRRILTGGQRVEEFRVEYIEPTSDEQRKPVRVEFVVQPGSLPPTNIHVLIGRNGSGKTRLLKRMAQALISGQTDPNANRFTFEGGAPIRESISGVGFVSFSAFDRSPPLQPNEAGFNVFDIGLRKRVVRQDRSTGRTRSEVRLKAYKDVEGEMGTSLYICSTRSLDRWRQAVETLESDPIFAAIDASSLADDISPEGLSDRAAQIFRDLSSGHQIVLLTITSIVAHLEERTLVLMDEPEGHLHPPLLSALVRAISQLLSDLNAFAIVATHSPVVLQEVPAKCVHLVSRSAAGLSIARPRLETFGENVGVLTREVFGLEVEGSGFHKLVTEVALEAGSSLDAVFEAFGGELGGEAVAMILASVGAAQRKTALDF